MPIEEKNLFTSRAEREAAAARLVTWPSRSALYECARPDGTLLRLFEMEPGDYHYGSPEVVIASLRGSKMVGEVWWALRELALDYATITGQHGTLHYLRDLNESPRVVERRLRQSLDVPGIFESRIKQESNFEDAAATETEEEALGV